MKKRTKHFFIGIVVREVRSGLLQKQRFREQAISILLSLLRSHDSDQRYSNDQKTRLIGLYFPYVITIVDFHSIINEYLPATEQINWLLCFFYIIAHCPILLREYWSSIDHSRHIDFFRILSLATSSLKGHPLAKPIYLIIIHTILDYITNFRSCLLQPNSSVFSQIFIVLENLQYYQSKSFVLALYNLLSTISRLYSEVIFR